ncbi:aspartyl-phosphate phosphatase Spo0E family protein [Virgibacillus sp. MSP4-1]|uniref:aspartyl-phosphate phosphatase Spo0E family protein n=1 Tax=Virgibacillus sp. MSP4-1 TaxID=2700081 RepID=UPI0003AA2387|nr:aspartyl-phosphate phosphatase Spo0E family protein [Virgibacillus sp. MSP4-1]QHS23360.1 aspartyl-phosphate phosphatase Spo0E family protein [Virgibacillus sp. MSP4-1]
MADFNDKLLELIQEKRQWMIQTAKEKGMNHQDTIDASQALDYYLNLHHRHMSQNEKISEQTGKGKERLEKEAL